MRPVLKAVHGLTETQRTGPAHKIIGTRPFNLPSFSLAHTTHMHCCLPTVSGRSSAPPPPGYTPHPSIPFWQGMHKEALVIGLSTNCGTSRLWWSRWYGSAIQSAN